MDIFDGNDELVAVEDSIDVGNVLWIFYDYLYRNPLHIISDSNPYSGVELNS